MDNQMEWSRARDELARTLVAMGHPVEFADAFAKQLGSPKAIRRMTSYLREAKPRTIEEIVDEMLAISAEIDAWRDKKESEQANASYTAYLNRKRNE